MAVMIERETGGEALLDAFLSHQYRRGWFFSSPTDSYVPDGKVHTDPRQVSLVNNVGCVGYSSILDALIHSEGTTLLRVNILGPGFVTPDRAVANKRVIQWRLTDTQGLREFARICALYIRHLWSMPLEVYDYLLKGDEDKVKRVIELLRESQNRLSLQHQRMGGAVPTNRYAEGGSHASVYRQVDRALRSVMVTRLAVGGSRSSLMHTRARRTALEAIRLFCEHRNVDLLSDEGASAVEAEAKSYLNKKLLFTMLRHRNMNWSLASSDA